jgi:hypothetical protein
MCLTRNQSYKLVNQRRQGIWLAALVPGKITKQEPVVQDQEGAGGIYARESSKELMYAFLS